MRARLVTVGVYDPTGAKGPAVAETSNDTTATTAPGPSRPTYGLDIVKMLPRGLSEDRVLAELVRHYDWLLAEYLALGGDPTNPRLSTPPYARAQDGS